MIKVEHLTKSYGDFTAVQDLSFEIPKGHVYGFLGPNGAGKSTTMNIMTGCLSPTSGKVTIGGYDIVDQPIEAKKLIGYLPEIPPLYVNETPREYLEFVGEVKGLHGEELQKQIDDVVVKTGIDKVQNKLIRALSKGYKQRVGLAQALIGDPQVIILDEPTVGLDPLQIIEIRDLIKSLGENHTVILSSHILSEVQAVCEKVLIIAKGKLVAFDAPDKLENTIGSQTLVDLKIQGTKKDLQEVVSGMKEFKVDTVKENGDGTTSATLSVKGLEEKDANSKLFFAFAEKKLAIVEINTHKVSLEDVFLELTDSNAEKEEPKEEEQA